MSTTELDIGRGQIVEACQSGRARRPQRIPRLRNSGNHRAKITSAPFCVGPRVHRSYRVSGKFPQGRAVESRQHRPIGKLPSTLRRYSYGLGRTAFRLPLTSGTRFRLDRCRRLFERQPTAPFFLAAGKPVAQKLDWSRAKPGRLAYAWSLNQSSKQQSRLRCESDGITIR